MSAEERYLREMLAMLREGYEKAAKPYIDRLAEIQAMRPPSPVIIATEQARMLMPMSAGVWQPIETAPKDGRNLLDVITRSTNKGT